LISGQRLSREAPLTGGSVVGKPPRRGPLGLNHGSNPCLGTKFNLISGRRMPLNVVKIHVSEP